MKHPGSGMVPSLPHGRSWLSGLRGFWSCLLQGRFVWSWPLQLEGPDPIFFFPLLVVLCEMARLIAGETPPGVHLLNSQGMGYLDLQSGIIWYSLLKVARDVQTLVFLRRRFNLMGVTVLPRRVIGPIIWPTSSGNECCCLVESRLVP